MRLSKLFIAIALLSWTHSHAQDPERLQISNDPAHAVADQVLTFGVSPIDSKKAYRLTISPSLVADSPTQVMIPNNIKGAVEELRSALPQAYLKSLRFRAGKDQLGHPFVMCESSDERKDLILLDWMVVYWNLHDPKSPLSEFFTDNISGDYAPDAIPQAILDFLCTSLHPTEIPG